MKEFGGGKKLHIRRRKKRTYNYERKEETWSLKPPLRSAVILGCGLSLGSPKRAWAHDVLMLRFPTS